MFIIYLKQSNHNESDMHVANIPEGVENWETLAIDLKLTVKNHIIISCATILFSSHPRMPFIRLLPFAFRTHAIIYIAGIMDLRDACGGGGGGYLLYFM